jgi:hypothetical protein
MNSLLVLLGLLMCGAIIYLVPGFGAPAILVCAILAIPIGLLISQIEDQGRFLLQIFIGGLLVRMAVGTTIHLFNLQDFFGGDAWTYDFFGYALLKTWEGDKYYQHLVDLFTGGEGVGGGWGMLYIVAYIYKVIGRNTLAIQFFNAVIGAATAPIIFLCAKHIFAHSKVARIAALAVAFYPSLVLWSAQGLKDGPIVFLLAFSMLCTLKLGERFSTKYLVILIFTLFALLSMRFYVFYMMIAAIAGSFVIGMRPVTSTSFVRQFLVIIVLGLSLTYMGVLRYASGQFESYGNLERVQRSRLDLSRGGSGFARDVDVSTTSGAITAIPVGMVYLLFAPFPWQLASLRQSITLPEMLIWWASFPLLVLGLWFTIKYRLRQTSPILLFTSMLTLAYSIFQGNVGTAYRQRAQLLVFYFIFVAVGFVLMKERREEKKRQEMIAEQDMREKTQARGQAAKVAQGQPSSSSI